jgi:hypothetical protein
MNNIEEAKKWFRDLFQGCYLKKIDKYPNSIFWIYDKELIRQRKLSKITGIEKFSLDMSIGEIIFEQDIKNGWFRIKYANYWQFLQSNFKLNDDEIRELTINVANDILNSKEYTTNIRFVIANLKVNDILNSKEYTTLTTLTENFHLANDILNSKEYTTKYQLRGSDRKVNEILNSKEYII